AALARARKTVFTGACIRIAGVDQQGAHCAAAGQALAADLHRRGAEAVEREHAGHAGALVERDDGEVATVCLADAGHGDAQAHARHRMERGGIGGGKVHGHGGLQLVKDPPKALGLAGGRGLWCGAWTQASWPWQCLYFLTLPQGQGSLRPTRGTSSATARATIAAATCVAPSPSATMLPSSVGCV